MILGKRIFLSRDIIFVYNWKMKYLLVNEYKIIFLTIYPWERQLDRTRIESAEIKSTLVQHTERRKIARRKVKRKKGERRREKKDRR